MKPDAEFNPARDAHTMPALDEALDLLDRDSNGSIINPNPDDEGEIVDELDPLSPREDDEP
jgi:hypothetical protein